MAHIASLLPNPLLHEGEQPVWMSHGDRIDRPPPGFNILARSQNSPVAAMGDLRRGYFGVQFHPEVRHIPGGAQVLRRFVLDICHARPDWTPESIILTSIDRIREQVGGQPVLSAVSGYRPISRDQFQRIKNSIGPALRDLCTECRYCDDCPESVPIPELIQRPTRLERKVLESR